jgi:hypothetical protein
MLPWLLPGIRARVAAAKPVEFFQENCGPDADFENSAYLHKRKTPDFRKEIRGLVGAGVGFEPTTFRL